MNRRLVGLSLVTMLGLAVGCEQRRETAPTQPPSFAVAPPTDNLKAEIVALFRMGSLRDAANFQLQRIVWALNDGHVDEARTRMFGLVDLTLDNFHAGKLSDPNGANPPTTNEAVCTFIADLFVFVGLPAPATCGTNGDGAAEVVGSGGGVVVTGNGDGGADFPSGALTQTVLVVITRIPDPGPEQHGPLNTTLRQYPQFFEVTVYPAGAVPTTPVEVGVCVYDAPTPGAPSPGVAERLQLAHNVGNGIEILPKTTPAFLSCGAGGQVLRSQDSGPYALARSLGRFVARMIGPRPLFAAAMVNPGGLGGRTGSFSPFGAVDPLSNTIR